MKAQRIFIFTAIIILITIVTVPFLILKGGKKINKEIENLKSHVGKNVVIKQDTLMIMKLSIINNSYVLEDGREISVDLIKNNKLEIINQ